MKIRFGMIETTSFVDGPGMRTVLFLKGCTLACPGCQSQHLWPADGGMQVEPNVLASTLALLSSRHRNVTISGGEPFQQAPALAELITELRRAGVKHIQIYTGYTWEELHEETNPAWGYLREILEQIDILVDGRFVKALDDPYITWRGSRNQRPIDVPATLRAGYVVTLDWDHPEIVIGEAGAVVLPIGLAGDFAELGAVENTRMCGQSR